MISRLFMGGGSSFTVTYNGILTPSAITTIVGDSYYNSWPVGCRNGPDTLVAYTKGIDHSGNNNSNPDYKISPNLGGSYGSEENAYDDPSFKVAVAGITTTSTGRTFMTIYTNDELTPGTGMPAVLWSDDPTDPMSWTYVALTTSFTQEAYTSGPVVELPDGSLQLPIEGTYTGDSILDRSLHTLASDADGEVWGGEVSVHEFADDSVPCYESVLLLVTAPSLPPELIIIHRNSTGPGAHNIQRSSDLGATTGGWDAMYFAFDGYARPGSIQSPTGTVICTTRDNVDASLIAYTSLDLAYTFGAKQILASGMYESEYAWPIPTDTPTETLVVFGDQPTSSTTNSDIKQLLVTEGTG